VDRINTNDIERMINSGKNISQISSTVLLGYQVYKGNRQIISDFDNKNPTHDIKYETYIPLEQVLSKPVPSACRRVIFTDEFGRQRTKLICGSVSDKQGQRTYFNN